MHIVFAESLGIAQSELEQIQSRFTQMGHTMAFYTDRNELPEELIARMSDADIVAISNIPLREQVLSHCPRLKMLSVGFTGLDHIDLNYCQSLHISVVNAAGYSTTAVSELAVGLMIDVMRRITQLHTATHSGGQRGTFLGSELRGKTVGIVGTGAIGTATAKLLLAFGCNVIAHSRSERASVSAMGVHYRSLNDLLKESDIVSLHVPLNDNTFHLIGEQQLATMRPGAILINTARGNVVDMDALSAALRNGQLSGAAVDVYEKEPPLPSKHPLLQCENCITVPHVGYATRESFAIRKDIVVQNIVNFLASK